METRHDPRTARILEQHGWLYGVSPNWSYLARLGDRKVSCPRDADDHFRPNEASVWVHYSDEEGVHVAQAPTITGHGVGGSVVWTLTRFLETHSPSTILKGAILIKNDGSRGIVYKGHRTHGLNGRL